MVAGGADRDLVADAIEELMVPGGLLDRYSPLSSDTRHRVGGSWSRERLRIQREVIEQFLQIDSDVRTEGMAAVVTAGVPGAGKSHATDGYVGYRSLDADVVKRILMEYEVRSGTYAGMLDTTLPDGHPLMPMEVATLVHRESVYITDEIRTACIDKGENIVVHGTLARPGRGAELLGIITAGGYEKVSIVVVEVSQETAQRQAVDRWWNDRIVTTGSGYRMGGRYTPRAAIAGLYGPDPAAPSRCYSNAVDTFDRYRAPEPDVELELVIFRNGQRIERIEPDVPT